MFEPTSSGAPRSSTTIRTASAPPGGGGTGGERPAVRRPARRTRPENDVHLLDRLAVLYRYRAIVRHRLRPGDGGDDHPGLQQRQDLPGAGAGADRGRALHRDSRAAERAEHLLRRSRAVLPDAVQDSEGTRPDPARGPQAAPGNGAGVQRHQARAADAALAAERSEDAADGLRLEGARRAGAGAAQARRDRRRVGDGRGVRRPRRRRSRSAAAIWSTSRSSPRIRSSPPTRSTR